MKFLFIFFCFIFFRAYAFEVETICEGNANKAALVVIDMQPVYVTKGGNDKLTENIKKVELVVAAQIEAINKAKANNIPIIFLEYEGSSGDRNTMSALKESVRNYSRVRFFKKTSEGMFSSLNKHRIELIDYLKNNSVGSLVIAGANGGSCVLESIEGALNGNCTVMAYSNGIIDFNFKDFIYPYVGKFKDLKPHCADCKFNETSSIDEITQVMTRGSTKERPSSKNEGLR